MHVPSALADDLYHKQGYPSVSNRHKEGFVIIEQVKINKHPIPGVRQLAKNVLQARSEVAVVYTMGLQTKLDQTQAR